MPRKKDYDFVENDALKSVSRNNFLIRSEAAQEVIERTPSFIERWALLIFLAVLLFLFCSTWFIKYPDIIQVRATLLSYNGPKEIIPLQTGRLIKLFVQSGDQVKQGDMIGWIESSANPDEVLLLSAKVDSSIDLISKGNQDKIPRLFVNHFQKLGSLQTYYQAYSVALQQFSDYMVNGYYIRRKQFLDRDINSISNMDSALLKQKKLTEQDNNLSKQTFEMNEKLFKEKVITNEEYRQQLSKLVNKQKEIPQINSSILTNQNQYRDKLKELDQLEHDRAQQEITFEQAIQTLKSSLDDWKRQYILTAPIKGSLFFSIPLQQNQFIEQGKLLAYVNPSGSKYYAQAILPQSNLGKIESGMEVQLRFDAYPYQEFGFVKGKINYISKVSSDSGFIATVILPNALKSNLNQSFQYKSGLKANALIITKNMRLMKRLYYDVVKTTSLEK